MASTVDAAISALCTLLDADLTDVVIHDGPPMTDEGNTWVAVGYQPETIDAVLLDYEWAGLGAQKQEERYTILCSAFTSSGDERTATGAGASSVMRTRLMGVRDEVAAVLRANPTLSDTVRLAWISEATLQQWQGERGVGAGLRFSVSVQARIAN